MVAEQTYQGRCHFLAGISCDGYCHDETGGYVIKRFVRLLTGVSACGLALGSCGTGPYDAEGTDNDVAGVLREWEIEVDSTIAEQGEVTFTVTNEGTIGHEFLVVKTDIPAGEIPVVGDRFEEPTDGIEVIDEIGEYPPGETLQLVVELEAGTYQLVCNLPGHYAAGMYTTFEVTR